MFSLIGITKLVSSNTGVYSYSSLFTAHVCLKQRVTWRLMLLSACFSLWKGVLPEDSPELAKLRISFSETTEEEIEEIASENSDSIYSSTPEVKA